MLLSAPSTALPSLESKNMAKRPMSQSPKVPFLRFNVKISDYICTIQRYLLSLQCKRQQS